ncbi:MAG: twin-arginine translocation signal domain-containing protein, partial [Betaproteobacteria bacterium]|nr:twin-arginine translocation signal domain-containing protein [Betaproteobacteria bacterium]
MSFSRRDVLKTSASASLYGALLSLGMIRAGTAQA